MTSSSIRRSLSVLLAVAALAAPARALTARDVRARLERDLEKTGDEFTGASPDAPLTGVAVGWTATQALLERAKRGGANLFIAYERPYGLDRGKERWLKENGMTLYRAHYAWTVYPGFGVRDTWPRALGFTEAPSYHDDFYEVYGTKGASVSVLAGRIAAALKPFGQKSVGVVGDLARKTARIALGSGGITNWRKMAALGADVLVVSDAGTQVWEAGQWALGEGKTLIFVDQAAAAEPGMKSLAGVLGEALKPLPVQYLPFGCLYDETQR